MTETALSAASSASEASIESLGDAVSFPPASFSFAGVEFSYSGLPSDYRLEGEHALFADTAQAATIARVRCEVVLDPALTEPSGDKTIHIRWNGDIATVSTLRVEARVTRTTPGHYVAEARMGAVRSALGPLTTALASTILGREGGVLLHAAGVILDGRALLFIGPSGAGKTTASHLCPETSWLARDRAAIVPTAGGWEAWGMAGGDPIDLERATRRRAPVGALLRVRRGAGTEPRIACCSPAEAVMILRESCQLEARDATDEEALLDTLETLQREVRVGAAYTVLDHPVVEAARAFMDGDFDE